MYYVGVITSTLFYAGVLCLPMLTASLIINSLAFTAFSSSSIIRVLSSIFINASIFGIPSLSAASFVIIYTMINVIPNTASWSGYLNYFSTY